MNRTIKETLTKLSIETGITDWAVLLPYALFRARNTLGRFRLTPFELIYGSPPPAAALSAFPVDESFYPITLLDRLKALECVQ